MRGRLSKNLIFYKAIISCIVALSIFASAAFTNISWAGLSQLRPLAVLERGRPASAESPVVKIDLSKLIALLREKKSRLPDWTELLKNPNILAELVSEFKGNPQRLDTLINLQSSFRK